MPTADKGTQGFAERTATQQEGIYSWPGIEIATQRLLCICHRCHSRPRCSVDPSFGFDFPQGKWLFAVACGLTSLFLGCGGQFRR